MKNFFYSLGTRGILEPNGKGARRPVRLVVVNRSMERLNCSVRKIVICSGKLHPSACSASRRNFSERFDI